MLFWFDNTDVTYNGNSLLQTSSNLPDGTKFIKYEKYTNTGADEESNPPEDINGETVSIVENIRLQEAQTALNNESIRRYRFYCKIPFPTNIDKDEELTIKPKITVRQYIN